MAAADDGRPPSFTAVTLGWSVFGNCPVQFGKGVNWLREVELTGKLGRWMEVV